MGITITGGNLVAATITAGITLSTAADNPVVITTGALGAMGTISAPGTAGASAVGIFGNGTRAWTVGNAGTISAAGAGIEFLAGGTVTNTGTSALIAGSFGIDVAGGSGRVINGGTISGGVGNGVYLYGGGTVTNAGTIRSTAATAVVAAHGTTGVTNTGGITGFGHGLELTGAASVVNGSSASAAASIRATDTASVALNSGIRINGVATVTNWGTVGVAGLYGSAIALAYGGTVANSGAASLLDGGRSGIAAYGVASITNAGTIAARAAAGSGLRLAGGGVVGNAGTVTGGRYGIYAKGAVTITNGSTANSVASIRNNDAGNSSYFYGAGIVSRGAEVSVANFGTVAAQGKFDPGIYVFFGGTIANTGTSALISGRYGIWAEAGAATVTSSGSIHGGLIGVQLDAGGIVTNSGTLTGPFAVAARYQAATVANTGSIGGGQVGVRFRAGGRVTNGGGGAISGSQFGISISGGAGTINNAGTITGGNAGVVLAAGRLTNSGVISGLFGAYDYSAAATISNSGTIAGSSGTALKLGNFNGNVVAITNHASFAGVVAGGTGSDTLQLAGNTANGTIAGLGSQFTGFETLTLAGSGANLWRLDGADTLPNGGWITGNGTLRVRGTLTNAGTLHLSGHETIGLTPTGAIEVGTAGAAVAGRLTVDAGGRIAGTGTIAGKVVDNGTIQGTAGTLEIIGNVSGTGRIELRANATVSVVGNLVLPRFVFAGPGTGETLRTTNATGLSGIISGFADHDVVDLGGFLANAAPGFAANTLTLHEFGGAGVARLHFAAGLTLADFVITPDGHGGTNIMHS